MNWSINRKENMMNLEIQDQFNEIEFTSDEMKYGERELFAYVQDGDIAGLNEYLMGQFMLASRRA
jgi:hypothetical protein